MKHVICNPMELFYSREIAAGERVLDRQESGHCIKVLRHREGDTIHIVDGCGCLYRCRITKADPNATVFEVEETIEGYGAHPYHLTMAVAPPKNIDRFEWFCEKATETGVDVIVPIVGDYSERKVFKGDRCERIIISAAKQSHKGAIPSLAALTPVREFLMRDFAPGTQKYICYCSDVEGAQKIHIREALAAAPDSRDFVVMIGPEGDFSRDEISLALAHGWQLISLGDSRLRIETAALTATSAVYLSRV
ncbi:MAG: 16S rRNA (uracil(1498)-N(3))-methyltransferase [Bacteroidales bacterium]|nr:16S rRNA (uracil(1498)-N(3))-methyltransferase [Bacteroidales bacterium]